MRLLNPLALTGALLLSAASAGATTGCDDASAVRRFLASTKSVSKKLVSAEQLQKAAGRDFRFDAPLDLALRQPWMPQPLPLQAHRIKIQEDAEATTLVLNERGTVLVITGGDPALLDCRKDGAR